MTTSTSFSSGPNAAASDRVPDEPYSKPVMRQTQAVIGVVISGGVLGAYFVDPAWVILPAIAGVGLVVAGLSGMCPMAALIARLPWNRGSVRESCGTCCDGGSRA